MLIGCEIGLLVHISLDNNSQKIKWTPEWSETKKKKC